MWRGMPLYPGIQTGELLTPMCGNGACFIAGHDGEKGSIVW